MKELETLFHTKQFSEKYWQNYSTVFSYLAELKFFKTLN
jgi:hypothetical protein